ncbi:hypothetical protein HYPSUDRAFT_41803 [Hypholoma sublateritium FD-334 SS-4]|uniref:Peptidase C14 caspase domain-containing protein n=1 Tax=Hypholoma sublateritium (strain FD-334 SS-4) TaxID=945553 RepID=A0A0D2MDT4_HYPSF|nr:hypothetical protein HYPSUDRAFT_41803 [Hypholoma sublateritium FD-334 SS-4]
MGLLKMVRSFWTAVASRSLEIYRRAKRDAAPYRPLGRNTHTTTGHKNLFALLIGINDYGGTSGTRSSEDSTRNSRSLSQFPDLRGAVPDANAFQNYLLNTLKVDESNITVLLNEQATRANIINAFQNLAKNDNIKADDSIFIFYAGHGAQALPPKRLTKITGCPERIELIIPYDFRHDAKDHRHMAIPDFTLSVLIDKIAKEKGNHITLAFDCCHSASAVRGEPADPDSEEIARTGPATKYQIPDDLDEDIWGGARALSIIPSLKNTGSSSYVLFAACDSTQTAVERRGRGVFSKALLKILDDLGPSAIPCAEIANRLATQIPGGQDPQCEGRYSKTRHFFQGYTTSSMKSFFDLIVDDTDDTKLTLKGGEVHGFCTGDELAVYKSRSEDHQKNPVATVVITEVSTHTSTLHLRKHTTVSLQSYPHPVASLTKIVLHYLRVYVDPKDSALLRRVKALNSCILKCVPEDAHIALSTDKSVGKQLRFDVVDRDLLGKGLNLNLKPSFIDDTNENLAQVMKGLAHYYRHLKRTSATPSDSIDKITISFFQVLDTGLGHPRVVPVDGARNLCENNIININVTDAEDPLIYGFEVTNNTEEILFPVLLYFDNTEFTIIQSFPHIVSVENAEIPWPAMGQSMTIGYGVGTGANVPPFSFYVGKDCNMEAGFFKLFLFDKPVDLQDIVREESVFARSRGMKQNPLPSLGKSTGRWGSIVLPVIQRRVEELSPA